MDAETIAKGLSKTQRKAYRKDILSLNRSTRLKMIEIGLATRKRSSRSSRAYSYILTPLGLAVRAALLKDPNAQS